MKKILFIVMAALTISCGDGSNNSSQGKDGDGEQNESFNPAESDGSIHSDTTTTGGNNSQNQYDTLK